MKGACGTAKVWVLPQTAEPGASARLLLPLVSVAIRYTLSPSAGLSAVADAFSSAVTTCSGSDVGLAQPLNAAVIQKTNIASISHLWWLQQAVKRRLAASHVPSPVTRLLPQSRQPAAVPVGAGSRRVSAARLGQPSARRGPSWL